MEVPKILILNNYSFNDYKGGGITLRNLFLGWPKEKLAIAHFDDSVPMSNVCLNYYKIGYNESQYIFPLNKISTEPKGKLNGAYSVDDYFKVFGSTKISSKEPAQIKSASGFKQNVLNWVYKSGIREFIHPLKLSGELKKWILDFKPDIIYCQPENISFIELALKAQKLTGARLVVHVMDDWPYMVYKNKTLKTVLRAVVNQKFKKLLGQASLRLGISSAMAEEFQRRYSLPFRHFHNPIDLSVLTKFLPPEKENKSKLVVYSGRIGITASHDSIIRFSEAVTELRKEGHDIRFNVYTDLTNTENDFSLFKHEGTELLPALKDDNFITKLMEADLLLYPVDFDQKSIDFIKLSFPTKLPSYMVSGVPIFCFGPPNVYSVQFMTKNHLGFVCNDQSINVLKKYILDSLSHEEQRLKYRNAAIEYAKLNFEAETVRAKFRNELSNC